MLFLLTDGDYSDYNIEELLEGPPEMEAAIKEYNAKIRTPAANRRSHLYTEFTKTLPLPHHKMGYEEWAKKTSEERDKELDDWNEKWEEHLRSFNEPALISLAEYLRSKGFDCKEIEFDEIHTRDT